MTGETPSEAAQEYNMYRSWDIPDWQERRNLLAENWSWMKAERRKAVLVLLMLHATQIE